MKKHALVKSVDDVEKWFAYRKLLKNDHPSRGRITAGINLVDEFFTMFPERAEPGSAQEGLQYAWLLNGYIKTQQIAFLRIGRLLTEVKEKQLFTALKHPDMDDFAYKRLHLGTTSLHKYLNVYDWVLKNHSEWLQPKPKGFIPDMTDIDNLMWIENKLEEKDLSQKERAELEVLKKKALDGRLSDNEFRDYRHGKRRVDGLKPFLSRLRTMRRQGAALKGMPPDAISDLDSAIDKIQNAVNAKRPKHRRF